MADPSGDGPGPVEESHYHPGSQFQRPGQFFGTSARSLRAAVPLARRLFVRDIRARYRLSVLGFAWIVLPALAQTAVWLFLNQSEIINSGQTEIPLVLYVLLGTLLFQGFAEAVFAPGTQLANAGPMLARVSFPAESLLLAGFADTVVNTVVRLAIAIPVLISYRVRPDWGLVFAPFGLLALLLLGFAIGLVLAPFGMLYQDIPRLLTIAIGFLVLVTPVAYAVPEQGPGRFLATLNPVSPPLLSTRNWLTGGPIAPTTAFWLVIVLTVTVLTVGWITFRVSIPHLVDRISS